MVTSQTLKAAARLAEAARRRHPLESVRVRADDLLELVNAFFAESQRADVATCKLERAVNDLLRVGGANRTPCLN
jgi:hypothetical protein